MRKITFFLSLLLAFVGVTATAQSSVTDLPELTTDESNPVYYTIKNTRNQKYAKYAGDAANMTQESSLSEGCLFYFMGRITDGVATVTIHNAATSNLCAGVNSWNAEGSTWYISVKRDEADGLCIYNNAEAADNDNSTSWNDAGGFGETVGYWNPKDEGSVWVFEKVENDVAVSIIYNTVKEELMDLIEKGSTYILVPGEDALTTLQAAIPTSDPTDTEGYQKATQALNAAIQAYKSNEIILPSVDQDYLIKNYERGGYLTVKSYSVGSSIITPIINTGTLGGNGANNRDEATAADVWTLENSTKAGYYHFKNKATGLYLRSDFNQSGNLYLSEIATDFKFFPNDGDRWATAAIGGDERYYKWHNDGSNNLVNWETSGASSWAFEIAPTDVQAATVDMTAYASAIERMASTFGLEEADAYKTTRATFDNEPTLANAKAVMAVLAEEVEKPYYNIVNCLESRSLPVLGAVGAKEQSLAAAQKNTNAASYWQFIVCEDGYKLYNANTKSHLGVLQDARDANNTSPDMIESFENGALFRLAQDNNGVGGIVFRDGNKHRMNLEDNGIVNYWEGQDGYYTQVTWKVEKANTFNVALNAAGDASYATAYLPFAVSAVEGAEMYTGVIEGDALNMTQQTAVPAETGIVLKGAADATTATLTIGGEADAVSGNALNGSLEAVTENVADYLVLGIGTASKAIGFYPLANGVTEIAANKAFLRASDVTGAAQAIALNFGGAATGIDAITGTEAAKNAPIYDLSGRRVFRAVKGNLYIQGGKKFIAQ